MARLSIGSKSGFSVSGTLPVLDHVANYWQPKLYIIVGQPSIEKPDRDWLMSGIGVPYPTLPASQGAWVYAKLPCKLVLANPCAPTHSDDSFSKAPTFIRERYISEKLNDPRDEMESRRGMPFSQLVTEAVSTPSRWATYF